MGNKFSIDTINGMRAHMHESVDRFFNSLKANSDGTPVDAITIDESVGTADTPMGCVLNTAKSFSITAYFKQPVFVPWPRAKLVVHTPQGYFTLANPNPESINACLAVLLRSSVDLRSDLVDLAERVNRGNPIPAWDVHDLARDTNLLFEPYSSTDISVDAAPTVPMTAETSTEPVAEIEPATELEEPLTKAEKKAAAKAERESQTRYEDALRAGYSEEEAHQLGWPVE